ncbi:MULTISPECIES: helix-turn-helix transcriptional regulator [Actinoalloteichus]|uniref:Transcriptional regulator n=1 Tax=Actinoalloteichus fjordicus TaxID=1612552 RepID=A0AAC9LCD1_9PSEU|nr:MULTISPECIES: YafY family protein [Actinoalloteichus]APU15363.1 putative transcriptional regulator [Actinoalloteichus fjordicus]APU21430.1 putative transcriptional regulator [Actinoalloteichus sp. GBA129-24]
MGSPRERMLRLLSLLQSGRRWTATDLAAALECTPRTLRRDIEYLRELGYPVTSTRGPGGNYRLVAGRALPPLMLEDDEAIATVLGLKLAVAGDVGIGFAAEAAQRAEEKLRRILPPKLRRTTDELLVAVEFAAAAHPLPASTLLTTIAEAISGHRRLTFTYESRKGSAERQVEPTRLLRMQQRWYLFAWDRGRADWRTFRLDRMTDSPVPGTGFIPRPVPSDDLLGYTHEHFRRTPMHTITLTLQTSAQDASVRLHRIDGVLEPLANGRCRYTAHVDSYEWLALVLILTDIEFTIVGPEEFREYIATHAQRWTRSARRDSRRDSPPAED